MAAVTRYMDALLGSGFNPIFRNVIAPTMNNTSQPLGNGANIADSGGSDWEKQYAEAQSILNDARKQYEDLGRQLDNTQLIPKRMALGQAWEEAKKRLDNAQSEFDRIRNEHGTPTNNSAASVITFTAQNSPAIEWGNRAQAAEQSLINRATSMLNTAKGAETARMANMGAHPLLGGGFNV